MPPKKKILGTPLSVCPEKIETSPAKTPPEPPAEKPKPVLPFYPPRSISDEMEESYLDYAMSVIISRALPDVRDGLKPVHRRILYVMHEDGLRSVARYRKSANVVGAVLARYHPHGDTAVYDSLVRMAQDFSLRYPLIDGQGNFGSIDGDSAAAYRYTEARMEKISEELLFDIDKETVSWINNYDGTRQEPMVFPAKIPQLLLNGTMGIAVGMATNIPPHNLGEIVDGLIYLIDHSEATIDDLMLLIKGPDFPTGGFIYDLEAIKTMYVNGRGGVIMRAKAEIEETGSGHFQIIVREIPYQVNKAVLVEKIAELVQLKKIMSISDIRDESSRDEIRIVIELKKDAYPKKILNQLFKLTPMQETFNMNMIALVDGIQPRLLNLKQVLEYFIAHRQEVVTNRTKFELKVAQERVHILEGLKIALDHIDAVIDTIKKSPTREVAHGALCKKFDLSDRQAQAILEMKLQTLVGLEQKKILEEYREKLALISELESFLKDPKKILDLIRKELAEIKEKYGDERKTKIIGTAIKEIGQTDLIPNEPMIITLTRENYIKRTSPSVFRTQKRGGKGMIGMSTKEKDEILIIRHVLCHDEILFFSNLGRVFKLPAYEIPQASRATKGQAIVNFLQLGPEERITAILTSRQGKFEGKYLFMSTQKGTAKKTEAEAFEKVRKSGLIAIKLRPFDYLEWVKVTNPGDKVVLVTQEGKCIQFDEGNVRPMGRACSGVRGIRLKEGDRVVEMDVIGAEKAKEAELLVVMENGLGKKSFLRNYRFQARGGSGVKTAKLTTRTGKLVGAKLMEKNLKGDLILVSKHGQIIRLKLTSIPRLGRNSQGVYLMRMHKEDKIASISLIQKEEKEEEEKPALVSTR